MQWEGKFGPAFVAVVVGGLAQLIILIFGAGMIWSDIKATQKDTAKTASQVAAISDNLQDIRMQAIRREGTVDGAITEIKNSVTWLTTLVRRIETSQTPTPTKQP